MNRNLERVVLYVTFMPQTKTAQAVRCCLFTT